MAWSRANLCTSSTNCRAAAADDDDACFNCVRVQGREHRIPQRYVIYKAVSSLYKVNEEAASSISELEMKIKVGKQVFEHKLAAEVELKKHALSSDEDDKSTLALTDKSTPAKKQKK